MKLSLKIPSFIAIKLNYRGAINTVELSRFVKILYSVGVLPSLHA
jgi:hypothetical protein